MTDSPTSKMRLKSPEKLALEAAFDGGRLTSDGGLLWILEVDSELGVCEAMAEHISEWRRRGGRHSLASLLKQRVYQIACGYEDQNDAGSLRTDPLLKLVCGALPESGKDLASQPTISRMENAVSARACYRIAEALGEVYVAQRGKDNAPKKVLLDFDATDDPTHGDQEGSYCHGYFEEHIYHQVALPAAYPSRPAELARKGRQRGGPAGYGGIDTSQITTLLATPFAGSVYRSPKDRRCGSQR
jgi:hypothetical protein